MFLRFLLFGAFGMFVEVAYSALKEALFQRDLQLRGITSLWNFPLYGLIAFLYPLLARHIAEFPWWGRGFFYLLAFYVVQYLAGSLLRRFNLCPWEYHSSYAINGLISITDAPLWFSAGLLIERIYPWITGISG